MNAVKSYTILFVLMLFMIRTAAVQAAVLSFSSSTDGSTRVLEHEESVLNILWLQYEFDDSAWSQPRTVWSNGWWRTCRTDRRSGQDWFPQNPSDIPPCSGNWNFMKKDGQGAIQVIQYTDHVRRDTWVRNFFRKRFTMPINANVEKATLYASGDNYSKFWLNGEGIVADQDSSLVNTGVCGPAPVGGNAEGGIRMYDVTALVKPGNNLLAANLLNTAVCGDSHPFGIQFIVVVQYNTNPTVTPVPTVLVPTQTPTMTPVLPPISCWNSCPFEGVVSGPLQCLTVAGNRLWRNPLCRLDSNCICDPTNTPMPTKPVVFPNASHCPL